MLQTKVCTVQAQDRPEQAASGQAAPGSSNNALLQGLLQVPDLATAEDREQSAGIISLSALLQVSRLDDWCIEVTMQ